MGKGGAEKYAALLSNFLSLEYRVFLLLFNSEIPNVWSTKADILYINVQTPKNLLQKVLFIPQRLYRISKIKRRFKIDLSISLMDGPNLYNILSIGNDKRLITIHGSHKSNTTLTFTRKIIFQVLTKLFYRISDGIICVSHSIAAEYESPKTIVIYNYPSVDKDNLTTYSFFRTVLRDKIVLLNVGRLHPQKGQFILPDVIRRVILHHPVVLIFAGDGDLKKDLKIAYKQVGLRVYCYDESSFFNNEYDIYFMGFLENIASLFSKSDLFIFPSVYEGFPFSILEAIHFGLPVLSSDCHSGPDEILCPNTENRKHPYYGEYGILLSVPNRKQKNEIVEEWSSTIISLLSQKTLINNYRIQGKRRSKDFSKANFEHQWKMVIEKTLTNSY